MRLAVVTTSVSSSNNSIPFAIAAIYSRISPERGIRRLSCIVRKAEEVIFGLVFHPHGQPKQHRVMPSETYTHSPIQYHSSWSDSSSWEWPTEGHTTVSQENWQRKSASVVSQENKQLGSPPPAARFLCYLNDRQQESLFERLSGILQKESLRQGWASWNIKGKKEENLTPVEVNVI
jgi:hypothetical protein